MIITKTPYRVSFIGGGSDYPEWYLKNGGETISTTINKYLYITCRSLPSFFKHNIRVAYSQIEEVNSFNQIKHPAAREILRYHNTKNIEIHYDGELPKKSGLGSSSAFTVGLHNALSNYNKKFLTKKKLASDAINFEQNIFKETVGSQDQTIITYGGFRNIHYQTNGNIIVKNLKISPKKISNLQNNLFLVFSGINRYATKVASSYVNSLTQKKYLFFEMNILLKEFRRNLLYGSNLDEVGRILHETWLIKKKFSNKISNSKIDNIYNLALKSGSLGGKILGAGSGGFFLFYVPLQNQKKFLKQMEKYLAIRIKFEKEGSKIVYNNDF